MLSKQLCFRANEAFPVQIKQTCGSQASGFQKLIYCREAQWYCRLLGIRMHMSIDEGSESCKVNNEASVIALKHRLLWHIFQGLITRKIELVERSREKLVQGWMVDAPSYGERNSADFRMMYRIQIEIDPFYIPRKLAFEEASQDVPIYGRWYGMHWENATGKGKCAHRSTDIIIEIEFCWRSNGTKYATQMQLIRLPGPGHFHANCLKREGNLCLSIPVKSKHFPTSRRAEKLGAALYFSSTSLNRSSNRSSFRTLLTSFSSITQIKFRDPSFDEKFEAKPRVGY